MYNEVRTQTYISIGNYVANTCIVSMKCGRILAEPRSGYHGNAFAMNDVAKGMFLVSYCHVHIQ